MTVRVELKCASIRLSLRCSSLAERELNWKAQRSIEQMCSDFWNWQQKNPTGYKSAQLNGKSKCEEQTKS